MTFVVHEEELDKAMDEAMATLNANRDHAVGPERFDWLYRQNPDGEAVLWAIRKEETGEMAGFTVCLPRRVLVDGQERTCWNGADFSVHKQYRTLGVAAKLRRAAKDGVDAGQVDFLYAHPNARMQVIHERVGHKPVGTMVRYAKPLCSGPYLKRRLHGTALPRMVAAMVDPVLRIRSPEWRHHFSSETRVVERVSFDDRFDRLLEEAAGCRRVVGVRDARYLNWRYHRNPLCETHGVLAESGRKLLGYALFTVDGPVVHVKDVFVAGDGVIQRDLVARLIRWARSAKLTSLSAVVLDGHPVVDTLQQFGFVPRQDSSHMVAYAPKASPLAECVHSRDSWLISVGDRDV